MNWENAFGRLKKARKTATEMQPVVAPQPEPAPQIQAQPQAQVAPRAINLFDRFIGLEWKAVGEWLRGHDVVAMYIITPLIPILATKGALLKNSIGILAIVGWYLLGAFFAINAEADKGFARRQLYAMTAGSIATLIIWVIWGGIANEFPEFRVLGSWWGVLILVIIGASVYGGIAASNGGVMYTSAEEARRDRRRRRRELAEETHQGKLLETWTNWFTLSLQSASHAPKGAKIATYDKVRDASEPPTRTDRREPAKPLGERLQPVLPLLKWVVIGTVILGSIALLTGVLRGGISTALTKPSTNGVTQGQSGAQATLEATNETGVQIGTIGPDGKCRFKVEGTINFGTSESNGPLGSSWHSGAKYGDATLRPDLPTGCVLIQVNGGPLTGLAELPQTNGLYEVSGTPGQAVNARINESPGNSGNNSGTFSFFAG